MTEKKLKICYVTSMHDWNDDRIFERAAVGLASLGHEVYFVAPAENDFIDSGVHIKSIPKRTRIGKHIYGPIEAFNKMKTIEADIYHFHNPNMMWLMKKWAKKGHHVFIDIHENYEARLEKLPIPSFFKSRAIKLYRKIENNYCKYYSGVTVVTESMKNKIKSSGSPILVVDNVPYLSRLKQIQLSRTKHKQPTIITSGFHSAARNCMKAVEALPYIAEKIPDIQMLFVGRFQPESFEKDLHERAHELGVSKHLKTEGMLPWLDNFERISKAHMGCVFYEDNLNNRYTLPNRLYEYMYCGLAVLGEDFPEVRVKLDKSKSGVTVNSTDPLSIANGAISILNSQEHLNRFGKNAKLAVEELFNFENALIDLNKFYNESITKKNVI
jgi:glycosyltransferase involved in cell wall biosynthesis